MADFEALEKAGARPELIDGVLSYWEERSPLGRAGQQPRRNAARPPTLHSWPGTHKELDAFGDDARIELIDGQLYKLPRATFEHDNIKGDVCARLRVAYQTGKGGPGGWWILPEAEFVAGGQEVFRPDVVGWRKKRLAMRPAGRCAGVVPDWICEVISPASRAHDVVTKREAFGRIGVRYRWSIDPATRTLHAFELRRGHWIEAGVFTDDDIVRVAPFSDLAIPMVSWCTGASKPGPRRRKP